LLLPPGAHDGRDSDVCGWHLLLRACTPIARSNRAPRQQAQALEFSRFFRRPPAQSRLAFMSNGASPRTPIAAAGVVCLRGDDVLLVRRGAPPLEDHWSLPGGRIEWGERAADAALRELKEETGCEARLIGLIDVVDGLMMRGRPSAMPQTHYVLVDYAAIWTGGDPRGGDDAREARFFGPDEIKSLGLWSETLRVIEAARTMAKHG
jgi:8-oxo-dGTP diphosphatase